MNSRRRRYRPGIAIKTEPGVKVDLVIVVDAINGTGSAAATRTPMVCCASISRAEQISHASRKTT
jgi:hypothetical protein